MLNLAKELNKTLHLQGKELPCISSSKKHLMRDFKALVSRLPLSATVAMVPLMLAAGPAFAQQASEQSSQASGEIIVTAQKREQALIDVPASITALGGEQIRTQNFSTLTSISTQTANFNVTYDRGENSKPNLTIRGVKAASSGGRVNESSVAMYQDDIYLGDESMLIGALFDIQRVEVLRGPQGTLFGRNTTGGLGHFISAMPTQEFTGFASALYGSDNWVTLEGAVSGPVSDRIRVRLAGKYDRHDGHFTNIIDIDPATPGRQRPPGVSAKVGAKEVWGIRGIVDVDLTDNALLRIIASYGGQDSQSINGNSLGTLDPSDPTGNTLCRSVKAVNAGECVSTLTIVNGAPANGARRAGYAGVSETDERNAIKQDGMSLTAKLMLDFDWASLTSITNYSQIDYSEGVDTDGGGSSLPIGSIWTSVDNRAKQFSQELRLNGSTDAIDWVTGLYYYTDTKNSRLNSLPYGLGAPPALSESEVQTDSASLFAQVDSHISETVTLTIGARYTDETRSLERAIATIVGVGSEDVRAQLADTKPHTRDLTGRIGVTWEPTSDQTYYLTFARGGKSVAFNTAFGTSASSFGGANARATGPVGQERVDAFELGMKLRLFDRKLSINSAVFLYNFENKQEILNLFDNQVITRRFLNVGNVRSYGLETEIAFTPNEYWDFRLGVGLLDTEIVKSSVIAPNPVGVLVPLKGKRPPDTPAWNGNAILAYHMPIEQLGTFTLQAEANAQAKRSFSLTNFYLGEDPARIVANLRLLWKSENGRYNAQVFVTNLFNEDYYNFAYDSGITRSAGGKITSTVNEPRLWGVKVGVNF